jgi:uncharacterized phage protein (TIGR01671 family)
MNRTLKFRVWDVKDKKFLNPSDIAINGNGNLLITDSGWYENFENQNLSDYVVQQYTGFKDIDRKEIFERDIIEFEVPTKDNNTKKLTATIDYGLGAFLVMAKSEDGDLFFPLLQEFHDKIYKYQIKIIGNSFENPELLKQ